MINNERAAKILLGIAGVLLAISAIYAIKPFHVMVLWAAERDLPQGWATLFGAIAGLLVVAWQTRRGFRNLIASQKSQAELDRQALAERAKLDREAREHQAGLDRVAVEEQRQNERRLLAAALHGELVSCHRQFQNRLTALQMQVALHEEIRKVDSDKVLNFNMQSIRTPVYDANIQKLGLLGASVSADVAEVYGSLCYEVVLNDFSVTYIVATIKAIIETSIGTGKDATHVTSRLIAIQTGQPDPGSLYFERQKVTAPPGPPQTVTK